MRRRAALLIALVAGATWSCASRTPAFGPAGVEDSRRALDAWKDALERADSLGPVRLLYDARMSEGLVKVPGTLAVVAVPGRLEATLSGPFGSPLARYASGVLQTRDARPIPLDAEELRAVLAGVWRAEPWVAGARDGQTLLRFPGKDEVEGVLELSQARLATLRIARPDADLVATYSGRLDPWPERIAIQDRRSGRRLELTLVAREPADSSSTSP